MYCFVVSVNLLHAMDCMALPALSLAEQCLLVVCVSGDGFTDTGG